MIIINYSKDEKETILLIYSDSNRVGIVVNKFNNIIESMESVGKKSLYINVRDSYGNMVCKFEDGSLVRIIKTTSSFDGYMGLRASKIFIDKSVSEMYDYFGFYQKVLSPALINGKFVDGERIDGELILFG